MRGPTRNASVMAATTSGWLMVWPKAMGSAVLSQARSAKVGDTKRSRSTAAMAPNTFSSEMPELRSSAIRRCRAGTFTAAPASIGLGLGRLELGPLELGDQLAAHALVGEVQMQRRHRDMAGADGGDVARLVDLALLRLVADPVVGAAARIDPFDDVATEAARALVRHTHTLDRARDHIGEIDVEQHVLRPVLGQRATDHGRAVMRDRAPLHRVVAIVGLAEGDRGQAEQAALHGGGDGARVGDVVGDVGAAVDARQHDVGFAVLQQVFYRNSTQSVGVPSSANLASLTSRQRIGRDSDSEWPAPLWLTSGATTQTSLESWVAISIKASRPGAWMPSSLVTRMRALASSAGFTCGPRDRGSSSAHPCRVAAPRESSPSRLRSGSSPAPRSGCGRRRGPSRSACARSACPPYFLWGLPWTGSARPCGGPDSHRSWSSWKSRDRRSGRAARPRCRRSCAKPAPCRRRTARWYGRQCRVASALPRRGRSCARVRPQG